MESVFSDLLNSKEFKEEFALAEIQARLSNLLEEKGVTRAELARRLDVSRARISQIFADSAKNLTFRLLFRSYLALGEEPIVVLKSEYESLQRQAKANSSLKSITSTVGASGEILAESLIAKLLEANVKGSAIRDDSSSKITGPAMDWLSNEGNKVIPFKKVANV